MISIFEHLTSSRIFLDMWLLVQAEDNLCYQKGSLDVSWCNAKLCRLFGIASYHWQYHSEWLIAQETLETNISNSALYLMVSWAPLCVRRNGGTVVALLVRALDLWHHWSTFYILCKAPLSILVKGAPGLHQILGTLAENSTVWLKASCGAIYHLR